MNSEKARAIIKYIQNNAQDNDKVNRALKDVKQKLTQDSQNYHLFRQHGLTSLIANLFMEHSDERVIKWLLSILTSCLLVKEFQEEVHKSTILSAVVDIFKNAECASIQHRACRVIGQQCSYELSVSRFHNLNIITTVLTFLKNATEDEEKDSAIKTLRSLANNNRNSDQILKEDGLNCVCIYGLTSPNEKLCLESIITIYHFSKWPSSYFFSQVLKGTKNLQLLSKFYKEGNQYRNFILHTFLNIFWCHSSSSNTRQYSENSKMIDYLCMANLPYMIICELQSKKDEININKEEADLILVLCKLCELDKQWKKFSTNVLPFYHGRVWMQITDHNGILLLITLISTHRDNLQMLPSLLRGLLGLEHCHLESKQAIEKYLEANLLPLLLIIFDSALKETCGNPRGESKLYCYHAPVKDDDDKRKTFSKEISKELLDFVDSQAKNSLIKNKNASIHNIRLSEGSTSTTYKKMNKIKFRTGKKLKVKIEDEKQNNSAPENSKNLDRRSSILLNDAGPDKGDNTPFDREYKLIGQHTEKWLTVIDYIIRLVYQIGGLYANSKDISNLCKEFLMKLFHYLYNSPVVHPSALKFLEAVARNPTSIQPILNYLLIPKLRVDLFDGRLKENCSQCSDIKKGVTDFLLNLEKYFNHHHQYGKVEVASRLHPMKSNEIKYSCITAFTHVVRCPKLLRVFLLEHKGLECILSIFSQPQESNVYLYAIASICSISKTLKQEYQRKFKSTCLYCEANCRAISKNNNTPKIERRRNLFFVLPDSSTSCMVHMEENKNCTFKLQNITMHLSRDKLASQNDVFGAMINGYFKESRENCISINDVNPLAMEMVIHFVYGCKCDVFTCTDVDVYFELLHITQMYFLPELRVMAMHKFCELIDLDTVFDFISTIFLFEEEFLHHFICSLLNRSVNFHSHLNWIGKILDSDLKQLFVDNVDKGLRYLLSITSPFCNCEQYYVY